MMRIILAGALILSSIYAAHAFGLGQGNRFGKMGAFSKKGSGGGGGGTNFILLVDGSSHLMMVDGTSHICKAGGC
jgi:hypothetical protein